MFNLFEKLAQINIKQFLRIIFKRVNSPNIKTKINYGKNNTFVAQVAESSPRSKGPYLLFKFSEIKNRDKEWIKSLFELSNFGSEPANNVQTYTEIYINNKQEFKSPITASSVIVPGYTLGILTRDPNPLVELCTHENMENKLSLTAEYEDASNNKYTTIKLLFYVPEMNGFSVREEKAFRHQ